MTIIPMATADPITPKGLKLEHLVDPEPGDHFRFAERYAEQDANQ